MPAEAGSEMIRGDKIEVARDKKETRCRNKDEQESKSASESFLPPSSCRCWISSSLPAG